MSWHIYNLQYILLVTEISHQGCIPLDHVQYYKNVWKSQEFRNLLRIFWLASDREDILQAGEKILVLLLGGKRKKTLDELRLHKYHEKMSRQIQYFVKVEARGPTSDATQQHVLWIYRQIQEWRGDYALDPLKWGWQLTKQEIMLINMTKQVAPPLKIVKYGCKTDCAW